MSVFQRDGQALVVRFNGEILRLEPWGENSLRVRAVKMGEILDTDYALLPPAAVEPVIEIGEKGASIRSGKLQAVLSQNEGLLAEIDYSNVPNSAYISENVKPFMEEFDPGMKHSVPHTWGTYGIMYNKEMVNSADIDSWEDLWDEKYADQIVMPDSMREMYMIAGKVLGYSMNTTSEKEVKEMTDLLLKQKPLVYKLANDSARDLMIGESAALAVVNSGEVLYSQELNENMEYVIPKEGTEVWTDCWAVTANAANKAGGEAWINFMLEEDSAEDNFEYLTYAIPNTRIADLTDEEVLNPPKKVLAKCETLKNLGAEADDMYSKYWKEYKSK